MNGVRLKLGVERLSFFLPLFFGPASSFPEETPTPVVPCRERVLAVDNEWGASLSRKSFASRASSESGQADLAQGIQRRSWSGESVGTGGRAVAESVLAPHDGVKGVLATPLKFGNAAAIAVWSSLDAQSTPTWRTQGRRSCFDASDTVAPVSPYTSTARSTKPAVPRTVKMREPFLTGPRRVQVV